MAMPAVGSDQPHLLVVDDDAEMGAFVVDAAQSVGYRCTLATDTAHFTAALEPDVALIMLDLMMPGTDGVELLRVLAQHRLGCCRGA